MGLDFDAAAGREQHDRRLPHVVDPPGQVAFGFDGDLLLDEDVGRQPQGPHPVGNRGGNRDDLGLVREAHQPALAASAREQLRLDRAAARNRGDRFTRSVELPARDGEAAPLEQNSFRPLRSGASARASIEQLLDAVRHRENVVDDVRAGLAQRRELGLRGAALALDQRAGMSHAPAGPRVAADHQDEERFAERADEIEHRVFLGAADLAQIDDELGRGVGRSDPQIFVRVAAAERVAADMGDQALADALAP